MKKNLLTRTLTFIGAAALMMTALVGCGHVATQEELDNDDFVTVIEDLEVAKDFAMASVPFFDKGVYVNYEEGSATRDLFYVFYDGGAGYTENGLDGMGLPFCCTQETGAITFSFGGDDGTPDIFVVESIENGVLKGSFGNNKVSYFEPVCDADPENFDAMAYVDKHGRTELAKYDDPNGWSVFYNAAYIEPIQQDNMVAFVYTGESAGTNMVTVTYNAGMSAKDAVDQMADSWQNPNTVKTESIFPGTADTEGYRAMFYPTDAGSGLYEEVLARDYMEGNLLFEVTGHNSGDEAMDMAVSDNIAMIFDSITFVNA